MDSFVSHVISILLSSGHLATRVFPPAAQVLRMFAERVISEVIGEAYVAPVLSRAREVGSGQGGAAGMGLFLRASAAVFAMTGRVVDAIVEAGVREEEAKSVITKAEVESFV
jgi:recyclin-1